MPTHLKGSGRHRWRSIVPLAVFFLSPALAQAAVKTPLLKPIPHPIGHPQGESRSLSAPTGVSPAGGAWTPLTHQLTLFDGIANPVLLTDGTVLVQDAGFDDWYRLTPDRHGSYVNGTWTEIANAPYDPLYHSTAVLPDGRMIIEGGEYQCTLHPVPACNPDWTNRGAIYDPVTNRWKPVPPPTQWTTIGDAQSVVLANGTYLQANCCTKQTALLNPNTLTWTATGTGKFDPNDEEGWTLLPNDDVLTVDAYVPIPPFPYIPNGTNSELYDPVDGMWSSGGGTSVQLWDSAAACGGEKDASFELGPGVLRPDGTVFYSGANSCGAGNTAIYDSELGTWSAGPQFPDGNDVADGPAALEPNGDVLVMTSPGFGNTPVTFFQWNGSSLHSVPGTPNAPGDSSYYGNMLVLPTGQILLTDFSNDIEIYTPVGRPKDDWKPVVLFTPLVVEPGGSYSLSGVRLSGMSQGAAYGDDVQASTNFPVVRITNMQTGDVFYSRTYGFSSVAVASGNISSTYFQVPADQETGLSTLQVVASGIASDPVEVLVKSH